MDVRVGDYDYRIGSLDAFAALDITRWMGPVLMFLAALKKTAEEEEATSVDAFTRAMAAMSAQIPQADIHSALRSALAIVYRKEAGGVGYAPIIAHGSALPPKLMYDDIKMPQMLALFWHVIHVHKLKDFFEVPQ